MAGGRYYSRGKKGKRGNRKVIRTNMISQAIGYARRRISRGSYSNPNTVYKFKRNYYDSGITQGVVNVFNGIVFSLDKLPNYGEYVAMFDSYKIIGVRLNFIAQRNQMNTTATTQEVGRMHTVIDYDNSSVPTTVDELREYATHTVRPANQSFSLWLQPRVAQAVYNNGITTAYTTPKVNPWIDNGYPAVQHFGVRYALEAGSVASNCVYAVECTMYLACKGLV